MTPESPMDRQMDPAMIARIEGVLERVKDPESELPLSRLGIVRKVRYSQIGKNLTIFTHSYPPLPKCLSCVALGLETENALFRDLRREMAREFPDLTIEFVRG